eukprot:GHVS01031477.1.p1 GENE.GHVS01031477.1~~GHVS01031477.1.p1  ORF type:complete len:259 (-),score=90.09 GHVS01031477.1:119-781(-)
MPASFDDEVSTIQSLLVSSSLIPLEPNHHQRQQRQPQQQRQQQQDDDNVAGGGGGGMWCYSPSSIPSFVPSGRIYHSFMKPSVPVSSYAVRVHGLSTTVLQHTPSPLEVLPTLRHLIADNLVVCHNAQFDVRMLNQAFLRQQLRPLPTASPRQQQPAQVVCTMRLFRHLFAGTPYSLAAACRHFGVSTNTPTHNAVIDACLTVHLLTALLSYLRDDDSVG